MSGTRAKRSVGRRTAAMAVALFAAGWAAAQMSQPIVPISTNPADAPPQRSSGQATVSTDASRPPAIGPNPARVVVVVFSDFQCPVCKRCADATQQIPEEFPGDVRVEFWQHALPSHARAEDAAVASLAAQRQGKFWEYHDELFRSQNALDAASLERYAENVGMDVDQFKKDLQDPELRARVKRESAFADSLGATGTPALMINGKLSVGWGSWMSFRGSVERELGEAKKLEASGTPLPEIAEARATASIADPAKLQTYVANVLPAPPTTKAAEPENGKGKKDKKKRHKHDKDAEAPASSGAGASR